MLYLMCHTLKGLVKRFLQLFKRIIDPSNFLRYIMLMRQIRVMIGFILLMLLMAHPAAAFSIIRDTEVESVLLSYVQRIFKAGGLAPQNAKVILINDPSLNAFVAGGQTIFIHTGLLMQAKSVDDVMFVLSHETGHIIGGHVVRGYEEYKTAQKTALISTVIGGLLAAASGRPDAGVAIMMGSQASALGMFTSYRQSEESAADRVAVDIMRKIGYSMSGFQNVMTTIRKQERLNTYEDDSYLRTHPLTQARLNDLAYFLKDPLPLHQDEAFLMSQAKLFAFLSKPEQTLNKYPGSSRVDKYARTIALYRQNKLEPAFKMLEELIEEEPTNPYFYELKGQFYFETSQIQQAIKAYQKAAELKPNAPLILLSLAQALLETDDMHNAQLATQHLQNAVHREPDLSSGWRLLAIGYGRLGKNQYIPYAMAEYYWSIGQESEARKEAKKALKSLPENTAATQRMQDILGGAKENNPEK